MKKLILILMIFTSAIFAYEAPLRINGSTYINSEKAYKLYLENVKFLDVRPLNHFKNARIRNAYHLYVDNLTQNSLGKIIQQSEKVVVYCNGRGCSLTHEAIVKMLHFGYKKIYYYRDGFPAWQYFKLPIQQD